MWDSGKVDSSAQSYVPYGGPGWSGAQWIRRVTTPAISARPVTRARVYASAMGNYEAYVNGRSIGRGDNYNHPTEGPVLRLRRHRRGQGR